MSWTTQNPLNITPGGDSKQSGFTKVKNEFTSLYTKLSTFISETTGHSHDGTTDNGTPIKMSHIVQDAGYTISGATHQANPFGITSSSGVLTLTEDSNSFIANGSESITSITGWTKGLAEIRWNTARVLTYNSTSLILQNSANRTTAIGDVGIYEMTSAGAREINYYPALVPAYVGKNKIINGDMLIDQRNNGATQNAIASGSVIYLVDRWGYFGSQSGKFNSQQNAGSITPPTGFINYLGLTVSSAYTVTSTDQFEILQRIEGYNIRDLAWGTTNAKTVTLQFQVYSSLTGTFSGAVQNSGQFRSYPFTYTVSTANTWTLITITIQGDTAGTWITNNSLGMQIVFNLGAGSTYVGTSGIWVAGNYIGATGSVSIVGTAGATFYVTGVQLERGSKATTFEYLEYSDLLSKCKRYCYPLSNVYVGQTQSPQWLYGGEKQIQMRATPTLVGGAFTVTAGNAGTPTFLASSSQNLVGFYNSASNWTTNVIVIINGFLIAEL